MTVGLTAAISHDGTRADQAATPPMDMQIRRNASEIVISGQVSSPGHEAILLEILSQQESSTPVSIDFRQADFSPPGWALVTELALRAILLTQFSDSTIDSGNVSIRGVASDPEAWRVAVKQLEAALLPGMRLETRVVLLAPSPPFESLCREQFTAAIRKGTVQFATGRTDFGPDAQALLDSLNEIVADCANWQIDVRVRADDSPDANRELTAARAQRIVDYLTGHGMPRQRISAAADAVPATSGRYGQAVISARIIDASNETNPESSGGRRSEREPLPTVEPLED